MNKLQKLSFSILAVFTLVQLTACNKIYDHVFGNDNSAKKCRITSFKQGNVPGGDGTRTMQFYYNHHGDIDSIIGNVETGSAGLHLFYFYYDKNHRLISYHEASGQTYPYEAIHTYAYENGRIVRDSVRVNPDGTATDVRTLEYDSWGRVIKESPKIINDDGTVIDNIDPIIFAYDEQGNRVFNSASYDNKVNFLGTNRYLMFTQRDYSRNNRVGATSYNDRGLPLGFVGGMQGPAGSPSNLFQFGLPIQITYNCGKTK